MHCSSEVLYGDAAIVSLEKSKNSARQIKPGAVFCKLIFKLFA